MLDIIRTGLTDIRAGLGKRKIWMALAKEDVGDSLKRTRLGWLSLLLNYLLFVGTLLFVFGRNDPNYVIYLACGLLVWNFITDTITPSVTLFVGEEAFIKGTVLPLFVYVMRHTMRSTIRASYALIGAVGIVLYDKGVSTGWLYAVPGMVWIVLTAPAAATILGILGVLMPDLKFFVQNIMRLAFFLTPVFWYPTGGRLRDLLYDWNPFTHYVDIVRQPVISDTIPLHSWAICLALTALVWAIAILLLGLYRKKIVFLL